MAITPIKALLFLLGGSAAATATAYVSGAFDTYFGAAPPQLAALPAAPSSGPSSKGDRITGEAAPSSVESSSGPASGNPAAALPDASAPTAETPASGDAAVDTPAGKTAAPNPARPAERAEPNPAVTPSFDLVRVESDGSMVVAGKAGPRARIDVVAGADVIGSAAASAEGDFAIVLDKPLEPGDYQISLRSTGPGEAVANSAETAIVSVPENAGGEVLAMVEEPGKPAELISIPEAANSASGTPPPAGHASTSQAGAPSSETPAAEAPAAGAGQQERQAAASTAEPPPAQQPGAPPSPTGEAASVPPAVESAAAADPSAKAGEVQEAVPAPAQTAAAPAAGPAVMVEAVEIEGSMVFVAGSADPGRRVRVYADSILLGDAVASPQGRFLVEALRDLPVGDYVIRVDALDADGATVIARAAVPFEREPGETMAAVAPVPEAGIAGDPAAATQPTAEAPPALAPTPPAADGAPAGDASSAAEAAPASATPPASAVEPPAVTEAPAAGSLPETTAAPTTETPSAPPVGPSATAEAAAADTAPEAASQPTVAEAPATAPAGAAGALPGTAEVPTAPGVEIAASDPAATDSPPPAGGLEVTAPKLQSVDSAVIIRRGDSLWRISRRVYGHGTRYSTIYLANQEQIRDPDLIWPGQVFKVPDRSNEGEAADMSRMGGQATTLPDQAGKAARQ